MKRIFALALVLVSILTGTAAYAAETMVKTETNRAVSDFSDGLARVKYGEMYGYIDIYGNWVIEPMYTIADNFCNGYAFVEREGEYYIIDTDGTELLSSPYLVRTIVNEGIALKIIGNHPNSYYEYEPVAPDVNKPLPAEGKQFLSADEFSDGMALVEFGVVPHNQAQDKVWAYIDTDGEIKILFDDEWCVISDSEKITIRSNFGAPFIDGYAVLPAYITTLDGKYISGDVYLIIDSEGNKLHMFEDDGNLTVTNCGDGIFCIYSKESTTYYYIDAIGNNITGEVYFPWYKANFPWEMNYIPADGIALVGIGPEGYAVPNYIDMSGNIVIPNDGWENASAFSEGLAAVCKDGKWGYINTAGEYVIEPQYKAARSFHCGVAIVVTEDEWFIIDTEGNILY